MEAKDTVLSGEQLRGFSVTNIGMLDRRPDVESRIALAQAEKTAPIFFAEGRKAGIKEVVEWLLTQNFKVTTVKDLLKSPLWQAQLKKWGIMTDKIEEDGAAETRQSLAEGHGITFPNAEEAIKWLKSDPDRLMSDEVREMTDPELIEIMAQELSRGRKKDWTIDDYRKQASKILDLTKAYYKEKLSQPAFLGQT